MRDPLSCDTSVAVGSATADGSVLFAKNSDRHANECQPLQHVPRRRHPAGAVVRTQYLELPEVPETWELIGSRPYWLWGFEMGVNEWGVAIGNEAVLTREPYEEPAGLIGMDLIRLGLERATTAAEGVAVIGGLTERYGQGGNCRASGFGTYHNSYIVADPAEAWVLETAGRRWAARRVREHAAISNLLTIEGEWDAGSADLVEHARAQGWARDPFSFADAYGDPAADLRPRRCRLQRARTLLGGRASRTVADMQALLRDHDTYGGDLPRAAADLPSICMHATTPTGGETAAALVAQLRPAGPRELAATVWTAFGSPCLSVFRPAYPFAVGLPPDVERGGPTFDPTSPWWVFERLQRLVAQAPSLAPAVRGALGALESQVRREAADREAEAAQLLEGGERRRALDVLRAFVDASTERALDLARRLTDDLAADAQRLAEPAMVEAWRDLNAAALLPAAARPAVAAV